MSAIKPLLIAPSFVAGKAWFTQSALTVVIPLPTESKIKIVFFHFIDPNQK